MCKSAAYTSSIMTGVEIATYYILITIETSLANWSTSSLLPFSVVRAALTQFFVVEIYSNVNRKFAGVIFSCVFRRIKLGVAVFLLIHFISPESQ